MREKIKNIEISLTWTSLVDSFRLGFGFNGWGVSFRLVEFEGPTFFRLSTGATLFLDVSDSIILFKLVESAIWSVKHEHRWTSSVEISGVIFILQG